ncbi:MAG: class I SAM-dependent methyltransferase [Gemmatimonadetes bacterium]|nr:class I SAM-dependent methyltransferase [Gemmatimonadota bacterium]
MFFNHLAQRTAREGDTSLGQWNSRRFYDAVREIAVERGAFRGRVLEIGPGEGVFAQQCAAAELPYVAIERNESLADRLRDDGFDVHVERVPPVPFDEGSFDLVAMMALLEHMPTFEDALELLAECHRVLRPGGAVLIQVPDAIRGGIDFPHWDYSHSFPPTAYRLRQLLRDVGFRVDRATHLTGSFRGPLRMPLDLIGFVVHSRFSYWVADTLGLERWLLRYHKTFEPSFVLVGHRPE